MGDSGTGFETGVKRVRRRGKGPSSLRELREDERRAPDVWLMLGDNAYAITEQPTWRYYKCAEPPYRCADGMDKTYQARDFDTYDRSIAGKLLRKTVLWPTLGNHDFLNRADGYDRSFSLPTDADAKEPSIRSTTATSTS